MHTGVKVGVPSFGYDLSMHEKGVDLSYNHPVRRGFNAEIGDRRYHNSRVMDIHRCLTRRPSVIGTSLLCVQGYVLLDHLS
jgi:hypothetical protein